MQRRAHDRNPNPGTLSNTTADLQPSPQLKPDVSLSQRAFTEAQNELNKLIEENAQLRSQVKDHAELRNRVVYLERADSQHREITEKLRQFTAANTWICRNPPQFYVSSTPEPSNAKEWWKALDYSWLSLMQGELDLAKEARKGWWKERIVFLEGQVEQERYEKAATAATTNSTILELKRKNEELQEQIDEHEHSEKHCHQVLNHLENFIENHPGEDGEFRHSLTCTKMNKAAVEKTMEWFEWAGEESRCAKEMEEVRARSTKRRKTRTGNSIIRHNETAVVGAATPIPLFVAPRLAANIEPRPPVMQSFPSKWWSILTPQTAANRAATRAHIKSPNSTTKPVCLTFDNTGLRG